MFKFRAMTEAKDADGNLLPDAARLTQFGKFLRKTSLDELPELWNVLTQHGIDSDESVPMPKYTGSK